MTIQQNELGRYIRNRRAVLGLSLSEFCRENGLDKGNISRLERGLTKPPTSPDLLRGYAEALQLQPDSEGWETFMRLAAIVRGKLPVAVSDNRANDVDAILRRLTGRLHDSWVKARDIEAWSTSRDAQEGLPILIRKLIYASTEQATATADQPTRIEIPGVDRHGWDGVVDVQTKSYFVPDGVSGWEMSVEQRPADKAERDFKTRKSGPLGLSPSEVTFIFVTSRKWDGKQKWRDEKRRLGKWKSVEVYDSSDLEAWLELAPGIDAWLAERLGRRPAGVISIADYWNSLSHICKPQLKPAVFLTAREEVAEKLRAFLLGTPGVMPIECRSPIEAIDFTAAYLETSKTATTEKYALDENERIRVQSRTVVVRDRTQWDGLSQATGSLNLLPIPSLPLTPEDLNNAVSHGHRIVIAATQFANHRLQPLTLPRPSRYDLEEVLQESGFNREAATKAARAAGGSLSVLKREMAIIPDSQTPSWCSQPIVTEFLPMLLVGAWDDTNEIDRGVLSRLSGRPYSELQIAANRLLLAEDSPLARIESRWRLVSLEDSLSLVGRHVTDYLLQAFETVEIEILDWEDKSFGQSADERLRASVIETRESRASTVLRHGISETVAILGSGFGPAATLPQTQQRADKIVRATLRKAKWLRWATLGDLLPLLAEASPSEFMAAINTDLKQKNPALARLLADDARENLLMSRCHHAGLLWALEGLAWSAELLPMACMTLGKLDQVDSGHGWGNRPAASLRDILLSWHPQTAAGVEQRIAVLKALAVRVPSAAWKVLLAMLPEVQSHADLTHRPVWRDWMANWKEGTSVPDRRKQESSAAELIVELVGHDLERWSAVFDNLPSIPEPQRNQLIDRLRDFSIDEISPDERRCFAERLRKIIQRHRDCSGIWWALPVESVDALEQVLPILQPTDICERHAWLFAEWPRLEGFRDNYQAMNEEIDRRRKSALCEIVEQQGFDGILKLVEVAESPGQVGATLAKASQIPDLQVLPGLLRSSDAKHRLLAGAYARDRIFRDHWDWVYSLSLDKWNTQDAASLLSQAGLVPQAWNIANSLGQDVSKEYWKTVLVHGGSRLDRQQLELACERLTNAGRPDAAIGALSCVAFREVDISPSLVLDVLAAYLGWANSNPDKRLPPDAFHVVHELFGWLQKTISFNDEELVLRLGRLEFAFGLDGDGTYGARPETLIRCLSESPQFFADLIAQIFPSREGQSPDVVSADEQREMARRGYRLFMAWDRVPGTKSDGTIDEEQLLEWLESARSLCRELGRLEVADYQIGEMLATWPQPNDDSTPWPCEEICDAIEEVDSDDLDHGFQIGVLNSRGVTSRSLFEGGEQERIEAAKYRRWAKCRDVEWPRTAASLRSVAGSYDSQSQREDTEAAERAQERY